MPADVHRPSGVVRPFVEKLYQVLRDAGEPLPLEAIRNRLLAANPALVRSLLTPSRVQTVLTDHPTLFVRTPDDRWTTVTELRRRNALQALQTAVASSAAAPEAAEHPSVVLSVAVPPFVAIDLEATGRDPETARIIEVAAVRVLPGTDPSTWDRWQSFVIPDEPLSPEVQRLTGITDADLEGAPPLAEVLAEFRTFVGTEPLVAHNGAFYDFPLLQRSLAETALDPPPGVHIDSLELAHLVLPEATSRDLSSLAARYDVPVTQSHRALDDALVLGRVVLAMVGEIRTWPLERWEPIARLLVRARWNGLLLCGRAAPVTAAIAPETFPVATPVATPRPSRPAGPPPDPDSVAALFAADGPLARARQQVGLPYEHRPAQREMARSVAETLATEKIGLIEAGTGTGKTKGYLHASVRFALATGAPVVISTHSKNLQAQLRQELEEAKRVPTEHPWQHATLQGMDNYLCLRKLQGLFVEAERTPECDPTPAERARFFGLALLVSWACAAEQGTFGDLRAYAWAKASRRNGWDFETTLLAVAANREDCPEVVCPFYQRCAYFRAVDRARQADLIAVNHALLLTGQSHLPARRYLIIDEAHTLEDAATDALAIEVSGAEVLRRLDALYRVDDAAATGLLVRIGQAFRLDNSHPALAELVARVTETREALLRFSDALLECLAIYDPKPAEQAAYGHLYQIQPAAAPRHWRIVENRADDLEKLLGDLESRLMRLRTELDVRPMVDVRYPRDGLLDELGGVARTLTSSETDPPRGLRERLRTIRTAPEPESWVYTAEADPEEVDVPEHGFPTPEERIRRWTLRARPISVAEPLRRLIFEPARAVVLTSATLTVDRSYQFLRRRLGIDVYGDDRVREYAPIRSDFDYHANALLALPAHLPAPRQSTLKEYCELLAGDLARLQKITEGRTLGLFTARLPMEDVGGQLRRMLDDQQIPVHFPSKQITGEGRQESIDLYRSAPDGRAVLLGLRSFWEGLDLPGLRLVAMHKIPFPNLGDPLVAARIEAERWASTPRDGFADYYVPLTALTFRQGFGRLLRTRSDRGVVVLYDRRLRTAFYRDTFLNSLPYDSTRPDEPRTWIRYESGSDFYRVVAAFLGRLDALPDGLRPATTRTAEALERLALTPDDSDETVRQKLHQALTEIFKHNKFRKHQREVITRFLAGRDVLAILPTASGKSLCFQLPALLRRGLTIVISPLVSLMKDQVDRLRDDLGINVVHGLNGMQSGAEKAEVLGRVRDGTCKLLYVAPERLHDPKLREAILASPDGVCQLVVDEAHCISLWGHQFRPEFLTIRQFAESIARNGNRPPILALTATATDAVQRDIIAALDLQNPHVERASFDRPNLRFTVVRASSKPRKDAMLVKIVQAIVARDPQASVIIYCARKRETERLASLISALCQVAVKAYHAGMDRELRAYVQDSFLREIGGLRIVVATKAFGMGIDKDDVRYVIHYDMPGSLEDYYQEAGRAGRDASQPAWCVLLYHRSDSGIHRYFISESVPEPDELRELYSMIREEGERQGIGQDGQILLSVRALANDLDTTETAIRTGLHWLEKASLIRRDDRDILIRGRLKLFVPVERVLTAIPEGHRDVAQRLFAALHLHGADVAELDTIALQRKLAMAADAIQEVLVALEHTETDQGPVAALQTWEYAVPVTVRDEIEPNFSALAAEIEPLRRAAEERLRCMLDYVATTECRRQFILRHFNDELAVRVAPCGRCDRCTADLDVVWGDVAMADIPDVMKDPGAERVVLDAVRWANGRAAQGHLCRMLVGLARQPGRDWSIPDWLTGSDYYGKLRHLSLRKVQMLVDDLVREGALERVEQTNGERTYHVVQLTERGQRRLQGVVDLDAWGIGAPTEARGGVS